MTKSDFLQLSPHQQEDFLNNGGQLEVELKALEEQTTKESCVIKEVSSDQILDVIPEQSVPFSIGEHEGFDIKDPVELLFLLDEDVSSGRVILSPNQIQIMLDFANPKWNDQQPYQGVARMPNGSGKDRFILAGCFVWLSMRYKNTISPITSSSGAQLDNQTCRYIKYLCECANRKFNSKIWSCKYREYSLDFGEGSVSYIFCYATDEPKKAEGYHPSRQGGKMGIGVSEDKSVPDDINVAMNKCTGYTHRLHVSTPGLPMGHFYDYCSIALDRKTLKSMDEVGPTDWIQYHVTAYECPHLSRNYIEQMKRDLPGGETGSAFKSQVLAEFGTTDEMVVIPYTYIWKATRNSETKRWLQEPHNKGGLDLSDGGAETVLIVRNGNKVLKIIPFRFDNTEDTITFLEEQFRENGLTHPDALVFADCCGIGKPMINALRRRGWVNMRFVDSRNKSREPRVYSNRGTELFFNARKLLEREELIVINDPLLVRQLSTRYYKLNTNNIHQLLTKLEQRSRGYPSPDRADAFNLAFWDYRSTYVEPETQEGYKKPYEVSEEESDEVVGDFSLKNWANESQRKWKANEGQKDFQYYEDEISRYNQNLVNKSN